MHQTFSPEEYTRYIQTLCPEYDLFNQFIVNIIKRLRAKSVVSLGCGTGNLERMLQVALPQVKITGVDKDEESLAYLKKAEPQIETILTDLVDYSYPLADVYVAGTSLHHLNGERKAIYQKILSNAGVFINLEMFAGFDEIIRSNLEPDYSFDQWKQESVKVDYFRTLPEEMEELNLLGAKPKVLLTDAPFALYIV